MLNSQLLREPDIWAMMLERFPWVEAERGELGEGLVHLDFAALRCGVERAADISDVETARQILSFVEDLYGIPLLLHPDVLNAMDVSFVEDLYLSELSHRLFAEHLLGPKTRVRWSEVAAAHLRGEI